MRMRIRMHMHADRLVLHTDPALMPQRKEHWRSVNFVLPNGYVQTNGVTGDAYPSDAKGPRPCSLARLLACLLTCPLASPPACLPARLRFPTCAPHRAESTLNV